MDRRKYKILLALLISLGMHGVFFALSRHILLPGMAGVSDQARRIFRVRDVDKTPEEMSLLSEPDKSKKLSGRDEPEPVIDKVVIEHATIGVEDRSLERKKEKTFFDKEIEVQSEGISSEELIDFEKERIKDLIMPEPRPVTGVVLSRGPSSASGAPKIKIPEIEYVGHSAGQEERNAVESGAIDWKEVLPEGDVAGTNITRVGEYEDITQSLVVKVRTFLNPATGEKFFSIQIRVKPGIQIETMPKDIVFLVDSSKSITDSRFEHIKRGLSSILKDLDAQDTFNIIAFKNEKEQLSELSLQASPKNIREGRDFVSSLKADGRTDIETALLGIVSKEPKRKPSYVLLVSDGRPSSGMMSSREIIKTVTRVNKGKRPIFSFGAGLRINTYFLDFISYQNRAWSEIMIASGSAGRDLIRFYEEIRAPIMTDLRYRISGMESEELFPKELPDFYHAKGLAIYGKYWDEDVFSMQLLGEVDGEVKELIFKKRFSEAEKGGKEIEKAWAFNKIYDRIGMETMGQGDSSILVGEIEHLSEKYGIVVPPLNGDDKDVLGEGEE